MCDVLISKYCNFKPYCNPCPNIDNSVNRYGRIKNDKFIGLLIKPFPDNVGRIKRID